ncbi:MAG TPA: 2-phospho-L-lactate guanylyltransferase [Stellaceae bacterium]|nr:2-phospho-L-lactate guanylyltransferase [Stellaceae bacterium]
MRPLWAAVPVKALDHAKQRLGDRLPPSTRRALALAMVEDVLAALGKVHALGGIAVLTLDPDASALAARFGAEIWQQDAGIGHTEAVAAAARRLRQQGCAMVTIPGDIPLVTAADIARIIAAAPAPPAFVAVPARDRCGTNAVLCDPADAVPLRFGGDSFSAHLAAARAGGIEPVVLDLPRIALDIDTGADLDLFLAQRSDTRAQAVLDRVRA